MKSPNSAPGEDGLLYGILYKLPSLHHVLATLFTKMNESCWLQPRWLGALWFWLIKEARLMIRANLG